eukprot:5486312-Prymnesium_polylepis.2
MKRDLDALRCGSHAKQKAASRARLEDQDGSWHATMQRAIASARASRSPPCAPRSPRPTFAARSARPRSSR